MMIIIIIVIIIIIATGYWLDDRGVGVRVLVGSRIFFPTSSRPALGPTQPPIKWAPVVPSPSVKQQGREADHSPPTSAEVKKCGSMHPLPHTPSWRSAYLVKHRDKFTLPTFLKK
jgi:hypothetical protein